jgi:hypothetical protein
MIESESDNGVEGTRLGGNLVAGGKGWDAQIISWGEGSLEKSKNFSSYAI